MLTSVFAVSWLFVETTFVSGLNFTLSKPRVVLGTPGKLLMMCHVTETDVLTVYNMQIRRETISGWKPLAIMEAAGFYEIPALYKEIFDDRCFAVNGALDKENPLNTYLTLKMDVEKMTYDDAINYGCELTYKSNIDDDTVTVKTNVTLLIQEANNKTDGQAEAENKTNGHAEPDNKTDGQAGISVTISVTIAVSSFVVMVISVFMVIVVLIKMRRKNKGAHQKRVEYINEQSDYIIPISDEPGDGAYTAVQDNDTDGGNGGYETPNPQRNVYESLRDENTAGVTSI